MLFNNNKAYLYKIGIVKFTIIRNKSYAGWFSMESLSISSNIHKQVILSTLLARVEIICFIHIRNDC